MTHDNAAANISRGAVLNVFAALRASKWTVNIASAMETTTDFVVYHIKSVSVQAATVTVRLEREAVHLLFDNAEDAAEAGQKIREAIEAFGMCDSHALFERDLQYATYGDDYSDALVGLAKLRDLIEAKYGDKESK